jgi:UDP-2,4-diacetamido-2,4,6-trideoxy-beta-L-altropyranose hydrolase
MTGAGSNEAAEADRFGGRLLVLRADASVADGTGHLMRTLALAQAWIDGGGRACWLLADAPAALAERIASEGIEIVRVAAPAGSPEDARALRGILGREPDARAAIDGLPFGSDYLEALGAAAGERVLVIDDKGDKGAYPVALVLNQNAHAARAAYPPDAPARFLLGLRYALLRREFAVAPPPRLTPPVARHLLVTFGGSDPTGMSVRTLAALGRTPATLRSSLEVLVIVGAANPDADRIAAAAADLAPGSRVTVERAVDDMPARMAWADLAVTSGGSTVWELARAGCPALVVETVPVERLLVAGLVRVGLFGHLGPEADLDAQALADEIAAKAEDVAWRTAMTARGMELVDGAGARRVAEALADAGRPPDDAPGDDEERA